MKATLLTENEVFGKNKLDIIKKIGPKAKATDFAIATGVWVNNLEDRFAPYYLKNPYDGYARAVSSNGFSNSDNIDGRDDGVRPALKFSSIDEITSLGGVIEGDKLKLGVYADNVLSGSEQNEWTNALANGTLKKCGKFPLDSVKYDDYFVPYNPVEYVVYEYNGKRAIRIKINSSFDGEPFKLSNGEYYKDGDYVWFELKDKIWAFDEKNLMAISKEIMLGGIQFNEENNYYEKEESFSKTNISEYLNYVFLPTLMQFQSINNSTLTTDELLRIIQTQEEYICQLKNIIATYKNTLDDVDKYIDYISSYINGVDAPKTNSYTNKQ